MRAIEWLGPSAYPVASLKSMYRVSLGKMLQPLPNGPLDRELPYLNSASVQDNRTTLGADRTMWVSPAEMRSALVAPGDLMICEGGDVGRAAFVDFEEPATFQNSVHRVRAFDTNELRFLRYVLLALRGTNYLDVLCNKATIRHLTAEKLANLRIPSPLPAEQRRIADFLDSETARLDDLIALRRKEIELLRTRRSVAVRDLVVRATDGERLPSNLPWVESLPAHWRVVPLKYVARYGSGHTPSRTHREYWVDCDIQWISLFDVGKMRDPRQIYTLETEQQISRLGLANSSAEIHPAGTVVLSRTASVGFATVMGVDMAVSQHFATWTCGSSLRPTYLLHLLRAMAPVFDSLKVGTTNVTVFMPDLLALRVPLPTLHEQDAITALIEESTSEIDRFADALERQVELFTERRRALITAAVTGTLDVTAAHGGHP